MQTTYEVLNIEEYCFGLIRYICACLIQGYQHCFIS
ncbi:unnamed protein product, partial [Brassica oleracea var. botrytis]